MAEASTWEHAAEQHVVEDYLLAIDQVEARLTDLDTQLAELAADRPVSRAGGVAALLSGHRHA